MRVALQFLNGVTVGCWDLPDLDADLNDVDDATLGRFWDSGQDLGLHIMMAISEGHGGCYFLIVADDFVPDFDAADGICDVDLGDPGGKILPFSGGGK